MDNYYPPPSPPKKINHTVYELLYQLRCCCCYSCLLVSFAFFSQSFAVAPLNNSQTMYSFTKVQNVLLNHICSIHACQICCFDLFFFLLILSSSIYLRSSHIPPAAINEILTKTKRISLYLSLCGKTNVCTRS